MSQHIFYLRHVPPASDVLRLPLLRDVRNAMRVLEPKASATDAENCIDACRQRGYGILGAGEFTDGEASSVLEGLRLALDDHGCEVVMDLDTARADQRARERKAREAGFTPEDVFAGRDLEPAEDAAAAPAAEGNPIYETAMVLVATLDGNPVQAAATALNLGRVTGQRVFYGEVVGCLLRVFPWVEVPLRQSGLL